MSYNPFGQEVARLISERGITKKILAERMREQGWPLKGPQEALSYAMKKQESRVPIRTTLFVCEALGLNEEQESRLFKAVRKTELQALEGHIKRDA